MKTILKKNSFDIGIKLGIILFLFTITIYAIDIKYFSNLFLMLGVYRIPVIAFGIYAIVNNKKLNKGFLSFKEAFTSYFLCIVLGYLIVNIGSIFIFKFYDPVSAETINQNILSTVKLLKYCNRYKVKRFIQASSIYANSEQGGFYGCSKKASEDYIERFQQRYNTKFTILRFGSLYGGRSNNDNGLQRLINSAKRKKKITYAGSRGSERRYIHVKDAVNMCVKSMKKKFDNKYLTLTGKYKIRITSVIRLIQKQFKIKDKDINFQNIKNNIHYVNEPKDYIPRKGINIAIGSRETFVHNLKNLILKKS